MKNSYQSHTGLFVRVALGITMLSAVADRFGYWGEPGTAGVVWGNWKNFIEYTKTINSFISFVPAELLGILATLLEVVFSILLILGYKTKLVSLGTGILLLLFATAMTLSYSVKASLDYSVLTSAAAAFLLSALDRTSFSLDNRLK